MDTYTGASRETRASAPLTKLVVVTMLSALVVAGVGMSTAGSSAATSARSATRPALAPDTYEKRVRHLVNRRRESRGLRTLRPAACPDRVAEDWSSFLAAANEFFHQSMADVLGYCNARYAGETLGRGTIGPRRLVRMWMHSEGHRAVLLSPQARRIGVGAKPDGTGRWVVAAEFMRF